MVLKADQERVKTLLKDTITLLCRNGLTFKSKFSIEALIGVTLDDNDVFLVSINELIRSEKSHDKESSARNSHSEVDGSLKKSSRSSEKEKQREVRDRETWQHKRKRPEIKEEEESSEEEEDFDEAEEEGICFPYMQKQHMPMWDEEDEHGSTGYDDSSSQSFPPVPERMLPRRDKSQSLTAVKQARVQAQPRVQQHIQPDPPGQTQQHIPQMHMESTDIVYIKEEPDDEESWPPPDEDELDEGEIHPDGMYQNMGAMPNSAYENEQEFHHGSGINYDAVPMHGVAVMMSPSTQNMKQQPQQQQQQLQSQQQFQQRRSATVTSDSQNQQQQSVVPQQHVQHQQQQQQPPQQHQQQSQQHPQHHQQKHQQQQQPHLQQSQKQPQKQPQQQMTQQPEQQSQQQLGDMTVDSSMEMQPELEQAEEEMDGENCIYAVCDYGEEYEMLQMSQDMTQDMSHEMGSQHMPSPQPSSAKKSRPSNSLQTMYFCQICTRSFASLALYNTHKDEHKGIFKFPCSECDKGYSTKARLNTHMRHHTGERFLCTFCGKGFMSKTSLKRHAKSQHDVQM